MRLFLKKGVKRMNTTTNYELLKPEGTDSYDIDNENTNMDIIDSTMKGLDDDKLAKTGDSKDVVTTFTSSDVADSSATEWTSVTPVASLEKHSSIFAKMSQMFKNIRYLYSIRPDALSSSSDAPTDDDIVISKEDGSTAWVKKTMSKLWAYIDSKIAGHNYLECSTGRNTADKVVSYTGFELRTGSRIAVRFTNTGTSNPASGNLTLNVNSTGAKTIVNGRTNKTVMTYANADYFYNNKVAEFVYDGTYWVYVGNIDPVYDTALSTTSENAVQNKKVTSGISHALSKLAETDLTYSDKASRPHSAGDYLIYGTVANPKFGKVQTNVSANEAWNTGSGGNITDVNIATELTTLNSDLTDNEYVAVGQEFGTTSITLPTNWKDLQAICQYGNSSGIQSQATTFNAHNSYPYINAVLSSGSGTIESQVMISNDSSNISMLYFGVSGTNHTSTSRITVFVRK